MGIDILNKFLVIIFVFSILLVIRHAFFMVMAMVKEQKYLLENNTLIYLGAAIAYIITSIFTGIKF